MIMVSELYHHSFAQLCPRTIHAMNGRMAAGSGGLAM
jgi:hypothetical protein